MLEYLNLMLHDKDFFMDNFAGLIGGFLIFSFVAYFILMGIQLHKDMKGEDLDGEL